MREAMTVVRLRKKPVEVEAVRWTGDNEGELIEFTGRLFMAVDPEDRGDDPDITGSVRAMPRSSPRRTRC